jgi:imidazolonepropionase-like amidohydrolase
MLFLTVCPLLAQSSSPVFFQHARFVDGLGGQPVEAATLVISGARITGVNAVVPKGARVIDAGGKTIVPGSSTRSPSRYAKERRGVA